MGPAASNLASALTNSTSGIITGIKTALSGVDPNFGVGRFEDYYYAPYVGAESPNFPPVSSGCGFSNNPNTGTQNNICVNEYDLPFQHLLSMQSDTGSYSAQAVNWLTYDAFAVAPPVPITNSNESIARGGGDIPEATVSALWMIATGSGLYANAVETGGVISNQSGPKRRHVQQSRLVASSP